MSARPLRPALRAAALAWLAIGVAAGSCRAQVQLGIDVLLDEQASLIAGKKIGLITNPSGVDGKLVPTVDRLARDPRVKLVQLYGPEHGIRGDVAGGEHVGDSKDAVTGLPVESLYGKSRRPSKESLARLDALVFDIQDLGSRTYTYASTLGEALLAAKEAGIPLIVLDRPNPIGGVLFEGPVQTPKHQSFIGWARTPVTHGMTIGELARFFAADKEIGAEPVVVAMKGWKRSMLWADTGLTWTQTSPHIPHELQAQLYVATGMVGGVCANVSEGVGYTLPFECIGAEWIDAEALKRALDEEKLPGVAFRTLTYTPFYGKFAKKALRGVQLVLTDPRAFRPLRTALTIHCVLERVHPGKTELIAEDAFLRHWTDDAMIASIRAGKSAKDIEARWEPDRKRFAGLRAKCLLYER